jgi:hypothetical protein
MSTEPDSSSAQKDRRVVGSLFSGMSYRVVLFLLFRAFLICYFANADAVS